MKTKLGKFLFKSLCCAALLILATVPASADYSLLYSFSSGDTRLPIDDPDYVQPTYGIGRIDFVESDDVDHYPVPTIIYSDSIYPVGVGCFSQDAKYYVYAAKEKGSTSSTMTTEYEIYDPADSMRMINSYNLVVNFKSDVTGSSSDIVFTPDEENGLIYAIQNNGSTTPTLYAYDAVDKSEKASVALASGYTEHKLVSLAPDVNNYIYVWSAKHGPVSADNSYIAQSSDIYVYTRDTLDKVAHFSHVRTGFDVTIQRSDDEVAEGGSVHKAEFGRGLVFIRKDDNGKATVALVVYDDATSQAAHIVEFNEADFSTTLTAKEKTIVKSSDIGGWNVDIESPIPDNKGGIFFQTYSGDLDASVESHNKATSDDTTCIYHLPYNNSAYGAPIEFAERGSHTNSELVVTSGTHSGKILVYQVKVGEDTTHYTDNTIHVYLWTGNSTDDYKELTDEDNAPLGSELEKPFPSEKDDGGLFFMLERKLTSGDEADTLCHWDGSTTKSLWTSGAELEIEEPPFDDKGGFYFVNVSVDVDNTEESGDTTFTLIHCYKASSGWTTEPVEDGDLGTFNVPKSIFIENPDDKTEIPAERLQSEHGFYLDKHESDDDDDSVLFVGAGPVDGDFRLTVMDWSDNTDLEPLVTYSAADMGGYSEIAGMVKFTEGSGEESSRGSSSGCNAGFGGLLGLMFMLPLIPVCRSKFKK